MKHLMRILVLAFLGLGLGAGLPQGLRAGAGSGAAVRSPLQWVESVLAKEEENVLEVGKKGIVAFSTQTRVGDLTLLPGRYLVQHHSEGSEHFVRFSLLNPVRHDPYSGKGGRVMCSLEYLESKASQTAVVLSEEEEHDVDRVIKLAVKGENVAHVF